ncbi:MAG: hypothetical protein ABJG88_10060 [Litorimonas sp.]
MQNKNSPKALHMFDENTHDLLSLFAVMVAADKCVYAVEIQMFSKVTIEFFEKTNVHSAPSEARLFMWFDMNREAIKSHLTQDGFENWFVNLLAKVSKIYPVEHVTDALRKIARADNEVHISEAALMVLVEKFWVDA